MLPVPDQRALHVKSVGLKNPESQVSYITTISDAQFTCYVGEFNPNGVQLCCVCHGVSVYEVCCSMIIVHE